MHPKNHNIDSYDYPLTDEKIAQYPLDKRDRSKLLIYKNAVVSEDLFYNISKYLPSGGLVVFNETRVIHARLLFHKVSGSPVEIFCLEPLVPFRDHQQAFQVTETTEWLCLVGNSKRWKDDKLSLRYNQEGLSLTLIAERVLKMENGTSQIKFSWTPGHLAFSEILEIAGNIPLPPYISRKPVSNDKETYQTIYARHDGSVAAPTAGLHFSGEVMADLEKTQTELLKLTLHVGAGTFKPVVSGSIEGHTMHAEQVHLPLESLEKLRQSLEKPITTVGTTTTRLLESLYWHGVKVIHHLSVANMMDVNQWDPYDDLQQTKISREESLDAVINGLKSSGKAILHGNTRLLIAPGYRFRYPDILITNFHQARSTLLLLVAAFIGEDWQKAYQYALDHNFRFLSYGDSCLFFRH